MDLIFDNIYQNFQKVFNNHTIDLSKIELFDPWTIGIVCLKAIENKDFENKNFIPPEELETRQYLKRMHFPEIIQKLTYSSFLEGFSYIVFKEQNSPDIQEILHCNFRDEFNAQLESRIRRMFKSFGMNDADEQRATALVGELGNNVFDHNEGVWPTDIRGAIIIAQNYPVARQVQVVVADPGIGFLGSFRTIIDPAPPTTDIEAIKLGLRGISSRVGEKRGIGLKLIQDWTINKFNGILRIQSGKGLVIITRNEQEEKTVNDVLGTLAEFVVPYR
jgi:hypothetical protein